MKERFRRHAPLLLILVVALAARLLWVRFLTGAVNWESAPYARIAQNLLAGHGYVSLVADQTDLMYPPLFPLLIAIASSAVGDWQLAAQCASTLVGALLVLPVYFICHLLYGGRVARIGAALAGLHPLLLHVSAQGLSEGPYLTLLMAGVWYSLRAFAQPDRKNLPLAGMFFGLAYLTRPEAFLYPFLAAVLVVAANRRPLRRAALHAGLLLAPFSLVAAPYVAFLTYETGHLRVEAKSPMIHLLNHDKAMDASPFAIDDDLSERGGWMRSRRSIIQEADASLANNLAHAAGAARHNVSLIVETLVSSRWLGSPVLFALALVGFFRKDWTPELTRYQALLVSILLLEVLALLWKATNFRPRYYSAFLPILLVWAAQGVSELAAWASATISTFAPKPAVPERAGRLVEWLNVGALLLLAAFGVSQLSEFATFGPASRVFAEAGIWLKSRSPESKTIMDTTQNVAFHADAAFVPFPECDSAVALRYLDKRKVDYVVLRTAYATSRRYLQDWLLHGIPDRRAQLVFERETDGFGKVLIYRWNAP